MKTHKARCKNCKSTVVLTEHLRSYILSDHVRCTIQSRIASCQTCTTVVYAERLPKESSIKDRDILAWLRNRKSPPRCLECGGTDLQYPNEKGLLRCHRCGEDIQIRGDSRLVLSRRWDWYTSEGELVGANIMSPSRGAVPIEPKPALPTGEKRTNE